MSAPRRQGRGQLSSIDLLPEIATPDVQWAVDELLKNERTQVDILADFNERLAAIGCEPISSSAFNRHSMRLAATTRRMKETQEISRAITERLGPDAGDQLTVGTAVLLKQLIWDLGEQGKVDPENLMFLARSLQSITSAQKTSAEVRRSAQAELAAKLAKAGSELEKVGKEAGLSAERIAQLRRDFLGVRPS